MPAKDQWADWRYHPCTIAMMKQLVEDREFGFVDISMGSEDDQLLRLGLKLGKINTLTGIINFGFIPQEDDNDNGS